MTTYDRATLRATIYRDAGTVDEFCVIVEGLDERAEDDFPFRAFSGPWRAVDAALAWAGAQADEIVVQYGPQEDHAYTAGAVPCSGRSLPVWPPDGKTLAAIDRAVLGNAANDESRIRVAVVPAIARSNDASDPIQWGPDMPLCEIQCAFCGEDAFPGGPDTVQLMVWVEGLDQLHRQIAHRRCLAERAPYVVLDA